MPAFNFFETILLISLAITFVLILFLVYHFKQRIATTEEKTDTMFDIINNMAQEMTNIRTAMNMVTQAPNAIHTPVTHVPSFNKIDVSDGDNESEYETESESSEDDAETGSESESEDGSDSESEPEDNVNAEDNSEEIKHISMDLDNDIDNQIESNDVNSDNDIDEKEEAPVEINSSDLVVEKLEEVIKNVEENDIDNDIDNDNESLDSRVTYSHSGYRKMNLANLRQLAITRGLTTDTSKMKKNDIISLLENNE